jgi:uncharacterized protein YndB with AHSA1/START domain
MDVLIHTWDLARATGPAAEVFDHLVDPALFGLWMAANATLDATPGGVIRWTHPNGDFVSGRYMDVDPPRRLVFSYGWERAEVMIPPGTTTVEIELVPRPTAPPF